MYVDWIDIQYNRFNDAWITEGSIRIGGDPLYRGNVVADFQRVRKNPMTSKEELTYWVWFREDGRNVSHDRKPDIITPYRPDEMVKMVVISREHGKSGKDYMQRWKRDD